MNVYVFGNQDNFSDNAAIITAEKLKNKISGINFFYIKPNEDVPFANQENVVIMDVVADLEDVSLFEDFAVNSIQMAPRTTAHDFDLNFQLRYLQKLGKIGKITLIALPMSKSIDYASLQSIFRKLVAQDMHGS